MDGDELFDRSDDCELDEDGDAFESVDDDSVIRPDDNELLGRSVDDGEVFDRLDDDDADVEARLELLDIS